jgi:polysaccharide transporter, PST family
MTSERQKVNLLSSLYSLSTLQLVTYLLPLITIPYLVQTLGVEAFGMIMFAHAVIMFINLLVDYGFILSATKDISTYRDNTEKVTEIISSVLILKFILTVLSFLILSVLIYSIESFSAELYYATFLIVVGQAFFPIWYFQGIEKMKTIMLINIGAKTFFTIMIFFLVKEEGDYIYVPLLNGTGSVVSAIASIIIIKFVFKQEIKFYNQRIVFKYFKKSTKYFISRIANAGNHYYLIMMVGAIYGNTIVGYFSMAERLLGAFNMGVQPISQALYPYIVKTRDLKLFKVFYTITVIVFWVLTSLLLVFSTPILQFIYGDVANLTVDMFRILFLSTFFSVTNIMIGYPLLGAMGFSDKANLGNIYGALVSSTYITVCFYIESHVLVIIYALLINDVVSSLYRGYFVKEKILKNELL